MGWELQESFLLYPFRLRGAWRSDLVRGESVWTKWLCRGYRIWWLRRKALNGGSLLCSLNFSWLFSAWPVIFVYESRLFSWFFLPFCIYLGVGRVGRVSVKREEWEMEPSKPPVHTGLWSLRCGPLVWTVIMSSSGFFSRDSLLYWYVWNEMFSYDFINIFPYFRCSYPDFRLVFL